jgi:hypothetical protein
MRIRRHAAAAAALAIVLTGGLSACGDDEKAPQGAESSTAASASPSESPSETSSPDAESAEPSESATSPSVRPANGKQFRGAGFAFRAPKGWTNATAKARELNSLVKLAAADAPDSTGFATNVNVVVADAGVQEPNAEQLEQISEAIEKRLTSLVPKLKVNDTTEVAGQPALDHEGPAAKGGVRYYIHQFGAFNEGNAYTITFSFSRQTKPAQRDRVTDAVLASWTWR